jgi:hypothetical protein
MRPTFRCFFSRPYRRGVPAHLSSLILLLQRSPLIKLLPEARVLSASGFSEALKFAVTAVAGLGACDSVSGVTTVTQTIPAPGSPIVSMTGGTSMTFGWQVTGITGQLTPGTWTYSGRLPAGMVPADIEQSTSCFMNGTPVETGTFPISITLHEFGGSRSITGDFTLIVAEPATPAISAQPLGGNFQPGAFVSLQATQTAGFFFRWSKDGDALQADSTLLVSRTSPRKYFVATGNPGDAWRTGVAFTENASWISANGGIGYDTSVTPPAVDFRPHITANVQGQMSGAGRPTSALIRIPFTLTGSTPISNLKLRVQCDDGFVAWLNGTEVAHQNRFANIPFNSAAGNQAVDAEAIVFREIDISRNITALRTGSNLLAVQAMNVENTSSDFLFNCELAGGTDEGTHTRRLLIPAITSQQAGEYTLTISNPTGAVTSEPAVLVLPPSIETHPASVEIQNGATAQLSVEAVISPPWTYQWFRGESGDTSNPIAGATEANFTTPPLTQTEKFWVRISNAAGQADSDAATVSVILAMAPGFTAHPASEEIDAGSTTTLEVAAIGAGPLAFQWYAGISGDTASPVAAATANTFTTPVLTAPASYWVRVTNASGSADSNTAVITIRDPYLTWRNSRFTLEETSDPAISGPAADPDSDGLTNEREYVFGTAPKTGEAFSFPAVAASGAGATLTFTAHAATGPGYAGRTRFYTVESASDTAGTWEPLPGFIDIVAAGQEVNAALPAGGRTFCRLRVRLAP